MLDELRSSNAFEIICFSKSVSRLLLRQSSRQSQADSIKSSMQSGAWGGTASSDMWIRLSIRRRLELGHSDIGPRCRKGKAILEYRRLYSSSVPVGNRVLIQTINYKSCIRVLLVAAKWGPKLTIALQSITPRKGGSGPNQFASDKIRVSLRPLSSTALTLIPSMCSSAMSTICSRRKP
jgi:hypothetical protein